MEKLENKIEEILLKEIFYVDESIVLDDVYPAIAQEVKDIAIAFAKWQSDYIFNEERAGQLFTDFIQTYYK